MLYILIHQWVQVSDSDFWVITFLVVGIFPLGLTSGEKFCRCIYYSREPISII